MDFGEKTLEKKLIYSGRVINLRCDEVLLPNGKHGKREVVEHRGGACVLCIMEGKAVLVRQFRYPYGEELLELPAGKLNPGEDPELAARRELEEETGLVAKKLRHLFTLYPSPGYTDEKIYVYKAEEVEKGRQCLDEDEFLNVVYMPLGELYEKIGRGEICDSKTLAALLFDKK